VLVTVNISFFFYLQTRTLFINANNMLNSPIQVHVIDFLSSYLAKMDPSIEICKPNCVYTENVMIMFGDVGRES
jgi:hypothetical protein